MKNKNFIGHIKDLVETGIQTEIIHYLKYDLKLDSEIKHTPTTGDEVINFTEKQREIVKQLITDLNNTKREIMKKVNNIG